MEGELINLWPYKYMCLSAYGCVYKRIVRVTSIKACYSTVRRQAGRAEFCPLAPKNMQIASIKAHLKLCFGYLPLKMIYIYAA